MTRYRMTKRGSLVRLRRRFAIFDLIVPDGAPAQFPGPFGGVTFAGGAIVRLVLLSVLLVASCRLAEADTVYAQIVAGGGYDTVLIASNTDREAHAFWLYVYPDDPAALDSWTIGGSRFTRRGNRGEIALGLQPRETRKYPISGGATAVSAYMVIAPYTSDQHFSITLFYEYRQGGRLISTTGALSGLSYAKYVVPVEKTPSINTGVAWAPSFGLNDTILPVNLTLSLFDEAGRPIQQKTMSNVGHRAIFFDQIFDGIPSTFVGSMLLEGFYPYYLSVLRMQSNPDGTFLFTSAQPKPVP
jgi:hypothetical protein